MDFGLHELISHDLYVSEDGDDENSGLSFDEPLRNISTAVRLIDMSVGVERTIHVSAGTYSYASNQQIFPFGFKENLSIIGEDKSNTIIVNDSSSETFAIYDLTGFNKLSNFSFHYDYSFPGAMCSLYLYETFKILNCEFSGISGDFFIESSESDNLQIIDTYIHDVVTTDFSGVMLFLANGRLDNVTLDNCTIVTNPDNSVSSLDIHVKDEFVVENCKIINNVSISQNTGNVILRENPGVPTTKIINNCLFANNSSISDNNVEIYGTGYNSMSNCTFVNNSSTFSTLEMKGDLDLNNSILNNPSNGYEISLPNAISIGILSELNVSNCDILGGYSAIYNQNFVNTVNWLEGNIDDDPLFLLSGDDPYQLTELSPCLDAGTPDTTGLFLPPWDLLHHQRVWDGDGNGLATIDMGCYEFGAPPVVSVEDPVVIPNDEINLCNYPNPFNPSTTISFNLFESGKVKVEIFNIKGQMVKTLMDCTTAPGIYNCIWNGRNDAGKRVASGEYIAKLKVNGEETAAHKMMLIK
ncbi:MAG: T9SS type A sorting domain-containing protein [Candidatus Cloacimonetes bacterium]|nr:T9SS type A sorting domain-containing protein [Candidatus Cloacimonadota bacterium]MCF7869450.1 T9SS type A sorting domain-containing protein [Candidatus Cloacimonadota bacterium]